ncbi:protein mono-ADP-ribosyltransferase PARP12 [Penaeus vannamei]|uniref:protein mono-ADP-ribosyltransferase PARP12 n=1 Tax=Penaeus vannamei TaxID=6689 RepID=UPI00387F715F
MRAQFSWQVNRALALLPHIFCLRDEKIALRPKIRVCSAYTSRNGCTDRSSCINIHICPDFIFGGCENEDCGMGHNLSTKHNTKAIQAFYLGCLSDKQLRHLVKKNEVAFQRKTAQQYLDVCEDYSEKKCKKNCGALHICLDFVLGMGECSTPGCRLSHDLYSSENFRLLEVYEFDTTANLRKILTDIIYSNPHLQRILKNIKMHNSPRDETNSHRTSIQESVNKQNIGDASEKNRNTNRSAQTRRTKATSTVPEESHQIPEICSKSISGKCKDTGCPRLHSKRHFHWQVTADFATWYDFPEAHVLFLENHFCDPENDLILLRKLDDSCPDSALLSLLGYQLWEIGFVYATWENNCAKCPIRSKDSQYYIRRLCSERSQKKIRANRFIWYFQDDSRKWLPFDAGSNKRLEEAHQRDPEGRVKIETGRARYRVDFSKMRQENESTKRQRRIQRRPLPMQGFI